MVVKPLANEESSHVSRGAGCPLTVRIVYKGKGKLRRLQFLSTETRFFPRRTSECLPGVAQNDGHPHD